MGLKAQKMRRECYVPNGPVPGPSGIRVGSRRRGEGTRGGGRSWWCRPIGSALGVALLIALTATNESVGGFDHAWSVQGRSGGAAAASLIFFRLRAAHA